MSQSPDRLYELLPAVYRQRDVEEGYPLRALLRVIAEQVNIVEDDIAQLYANWFIETSEDWVVPYIGDLVGYQTVHEAGEPGDVATPREQQREKILIPRRDVANTIGNRRRKGTLALLELLAGDAAGWPARAVEFYKLLGWTQNVNHLYLTRGRTVDLRQGHALDHLDGPFDTLAHSVEVRRIISHRTQGRYNIPSVGLFVWRLKSYSVTHTPAYCLDATPNCYTFSVLGNDAPLYNRPQPESEPTHIAGELNLPTPIRRRAFEEHTAGQAGPAQASAAYYGLGKSVTIWAPDWPKKGAEQPIPREIIIPADLTDWQYRAPRGFVAVDPELGRIVFPAMQAPAQGVAVSYQYAFSADIGGGEYDRPIAQPSVLSVSQFRSQDFKDAQGLATKLRDARDPVAQYLRAHFSPETQQLLEDYDGSSVPSDELVGALASELNRVLTDEEFYDQSRFTAIPLPDEAQALIGHNPQDQHLVRLNRLLLEAAYPDEIAKSYAIYIVERKQTINDVLKQWQAEQPRHAVIEIAESGVYTEPLAIGLGQGQSLHLRAALGARPILRLLDYMADRPDAFSVAGAAGSRFVLDGLLITGRNLKISGPDTGTSAEGDLCEVVIHHCTLVPGWAVYHNCEPKRPADPSLVLWNTSARLKIEHSIVGAIQVVADQVKEEPLQIDISDSILDATSHELVALGALNLPLAYASLTIKRSTVIGQVQTHAIELGENCIFDGLVRVGRRQQGCLRFCYVTPGSRTPRRFHCQPDLVEAQIPQGAARDAEVERERMRLRPQFNSTRYGIPTYCQLADTCAIEIKRGADDQSEMGAFHDLYQPQRAANLRARLDEYTPAGMDAGIIYAS